MSPASFFVCRKPRDGRAVQKSLSDPPKARGAKVSTFCKGKRLSEGEAEAMPYFAAERGNDRFAWPEGPLFFCTKVAQGSQGTIGSLRRFFPAFLSAGGKKGGRRRQGKPSAQQEVCKRQRGAVQSLPQSALTLGQLPHQREPLVRRYGAGFALSGKADLFSWENRSAFIAFLTDVLFQIPAGSPPAPPRLHGAWRCRWRPAGRLRFCGP